MERPEVPLEQAHEHIHHHASQHGQQKWWVLGVALSSAIFAALAAVASLQAGHQINEALISQLEASDHWSYYQAKSIKANILASRQEILASLGKAPAASEHGAAETPPAAEGSATEGGEGKTHAAAEGSEETKESKSAKSVAKYAKEQEEIKAEATKLEKERVAHLDHHVKLATAVTMFQICIAISAISVLTNRIAFWYLSLVFGMAGVYYLAIGILF